MVNFLGPKVFISSTFRDLTVERDKLSTSLESLGSCPIRWDSPGIAEPPGVPPVAAAVARVADADVLLTVIGFRYGSPVDHKVWPRELYYCVGLSPTEAEIRHALETRKTVFAYVRQGVWDDWHRTPRDEPSTGTYDDFHRTMKLVGTLMEEYYPAGRACVRPFLSVDDIIADLRGRVGDASKQTWLRAEAGIHERAAVVAMDALRRLSGTEVESELRRVFRTGDGKRYCSLRQQISNISADIRRAGEESAAALEELNALEVQFRLLKEKLLFDLLVPTLPMDLGAGPVPEAFERAWSTVESEMCGAISSEDPLRCRKAGVRE